MVGLNRNIWLLLFVLGCTACTTPRLHPGDPRIAWLGRVAHRADAARFAWPASGFRICFAGPAIAFSLRDEARTNEGPPAARRGFYSLSIDGREAQILAGNAWLSHHVIEDLPEGAHTLTLRRRNEPLVGTSAFYGVSLPQGGRFLTCPRSKKRLVFIGDSMSAAYGNEGERAECPFSPATQNAQTSFAAMIANELGVEYEIVAWSGIGVSRDYGGDEEGRMHPILASPLGKAGAEVASDAGVGVVVLTLGGNDFEQGLPNEGVFIEEYAKILVKSAALYPAATLVVHHMLSDAWPKDVRALSVARRLSAKAVAVARRELGSRVVVVESERVREGEGFGCQWHPSAATHRRVAFDLVGFLRDLLGDI